MEIPWFPAMTPAEISQTETLPTHYAWMACHFDSEGDSLTDMPESLPEGCILIVNDQIPYAGQSGEIICRQLTDSVNRWGLHGVLLDFERPVKAQLREAVELLVSALPCPVVCGQDLKIPGLTHLLPMPGLLEPPEAYFRDKKGAWLEVRKQAESYRINSGGSTVSPAAEPAECAAETLSEPQLCIHYQTALGSDIADFSLWRDRQDRRTIIEIAKLAGIDAMVGLYQELGKAIL